MPIYNLSELLFTSPYFSAMDCVLHKTGAIYCSSELTSGLRAYTAMASHQVTSSLELKEKLGADWYQKNIEDLNKQAAHDFAMSVCRKLSDRTPVINPAPLKVPGWDQPEYLAFWEELIRTRVKEIRFNDNWQFSSGCTFEFVAAMKSEIPTLDADGHEITFKTAVASIEGAILKFDHFDTRRLQVNLERLKNHPMDVRQLGSTIKKVHS